MTLFSTLPWRVRLASLRFRRQRADYYEYLSDVLIQTQGRKTFKDILLDDVERYGLKHPRGVLSDYWAHQYETSGGDLYHCFVSTIPADDLLLLKLGQQSGAGALEHSLGDLARTCRTLEKTKDTLLSTLSVGIIALVLLLLALLAIPWFTVPKLQAAFDIPYEYLGSLTQRLYSFSELIKHLGWMLALFLMVIVVLVLTSLPHWTGRLRQALDQVFIWRLYKDFQGVRFLSAVAMIVKQRGGVSTQLRDALLAVNQAYPSAWLASHVQQMLGHIDQGATTVAVFDTGLVDQETLWYLTDMVAVKGLDAGLQQARVRLESYALKRIAQRALVLRWVLLLSAVFSVLVLAFWHIVSVQEMKSALLMFYAS